MDTCGQPGRAYSSLFALLSAGGSGDGVATLPVKDHDQPVAALLLDDAAPAMVTPLLDMQAIARLKDPADRRHQEDQQHIVSIPHAPETFIA